MGTLFNQPVRNYYDLNEQDIFLFIDQIKEIALKSNLNVDQVIKIFEIKELERKNNIKVSNGNIHDEQMLGFGVLFKDLNENLSHICEALDKQ